MFDNIFPAYLKASEQLKGNPDQWKAYESSGNCVVLAGPGSGKTKLLVTKIAKMLNEDIRPPHGLACITYSTECAREIKRRLSDLGIEPKRNIYIGTVHGYCLNHVIKPYASLAGYSLPTPLKVADSKTWDDIFSDSLREIGNTDPPNYWKTSFDKYRRTYLDRKSHEFLKSSPTLPRLIEKFEHNLRKAGYVDFDDLILVGLRLVQQNNWIGQSLKARFPVLVIDEYQDLGVPLHKLVAQLMTNTGVRLFAVGDPDQSIYGFNGAQPHLLRELSDDKLVEKVELSFNYRCAKKIVGNSVVALGESRNFQSVSGEDGEINFWECPNGIEQQAEVICNNIIPSSLTRREGRVHGDISVLYLDKNDAAHITRAAIKHKIKYIGGDQEIRYRRTPVLLWLEDCAAWSSGGWRKGKPRLSTILNFWLYLHENIETKLEEKTIRQNLVDFLYSYRDSKVSLKTWLDGVLSLGLIKILEKSGTKADELEALSHFSKIVSDPGKMGQFNLEGFGELRGSPDHINLTTLHSSKGLEFDVVIMMGLEQGRMPNYRINPADEEFSEERRKFYVGLTRAKREVHLLYSGWYKTPYRKFENGPSQFVIEQREKYESYIQDSK